MKFIAKEKIEIDREISDLDRFALEFTSIVKKHISYVIISGYVSILLGRARASEDIDIIIPKIDFPAFQSLLQDLKKHGFSCLNAEKDTDIFNYLEDNLPIRFAYHKRIIPNIEMKWVKNKFDERALRKTIEVILPEGTLCISHLELQIAFKEAVLKSPKDIQDARHLRRVADEYIDEQLIQRYKEQLHEFFYKRKSKK